MLPVLLGGRAADTLHISKARSEEEMKIDAEKCHGNPLPFQSIYYHLHIHDTFVRDHTTICMEAIQGATYSHEEGGGGTSLLLETCDTIAFDLQINRESVHLLGEDGRCDGRAH